MTEKELVYWLQGMLEYTEVSTLSEADLRMKMQGIKDHLKLVFTKVTAPVTGPIPITITIPKDPVKADPNKFDESRIRKIFDSIPKDKTPSPYYVPYPGYPVPTWVHPPGPYWPGDYIPGQGPWC